MKHLRSKSRQGKAGFTLVEVLVAIVIIGITLSMFAYLVNSLRISSNARNETSAAVFARNYFDTLRSLWQVESRYDAVGGNATATNDERPELVAPPSGFERYTLTVQSVSATGQNIGGATSVTYSAGTAGTRMSFPYSANDYLREITIVLTDRGGEVYSFSTKIVRPPNNL